MIEVYKNGLLQHCAYRQHRASVAHLPVAKTAVQRMACLGIVPVQR